MTVAQAIRTTLLADAEITAIFTGGIYTIDETGRMGLSFTNTPDAFDGAKMLPTLLIKPRQEFPMGGLSDEASQAISASEVVEFYMYEDSGTTNIELGAQRLFELLQNQRIASVGRLQYVGCVKDRYAEDLNGASLARHDYQRFYMKQPN